MTLFAVGVRLVLAVVAAFVAIIIVAALAVMVAPGLIESIIHS
jgi:hypothetical protein